MFYYLYKISEELSEKLECADIDKLKEKSTTDVFDDKTTIKENYEWSSFNQSKISGHVILKGLNKKILFEIRLNSRFLLIKSSNQKLKDETLKKLEFFFNSEMDAELENFLPNVANEYKLFCFYAEDFDLKFVHNGSIIDGDIDDKIEAKYCQQKLGKDYRLLEADIQLNDDISFYYFRKSIKIPDEYNESSKEQVLQTFEHAMI